MTDDVEAAAAFFNADDETQAPEKVETAPVPTTEGEKPEVETPEAAEIDPDDEDGKTVPLKAVVEERKKRQELEKQLKALADGQEALRKAVTPAQKPKDIYEAFDQDSDGVLRDLNGELKKLVSEDPYGNAEKIEQLRDLKDELRRREVTKLTNQLSQQSQAQQVIADVKAACPDIEQLVAPIDGYENGKLIKFAVEELGYAPEDVEELDPRRGMSAARKVKALYKMYKTANPEPQKKEVRPKPAAVEPPGQGIPKQQVNLNKLFEQAKRTGSADDWAAYLEAKGL